MKPARNVYIAGAFNTPFIGKFHPDFIWKKHPEFGKRENPTLEEYVHRAAIGALEDAGIAPADVQKGFVGNFCRYGPNWNTGVFVALVLPSASEYVVIWARKLASSGGVSLCWILYSSICDRSV